MSSLAGLVEKGRVAPDWAAALAPVDDRIAAMGRFLRDEDAAGRGYQPAADRVFRAFERPPTSACWWWDRTPTPTRSTRSD